MQNHQDLKDFHTKGLLAWGQWNVTGFNFNWQVDQVRNGGRFVPGFKFPYLDTIVDVNPKKPQNTTVNLTIMPYEADFRYIGEHGLPFNVRMLNLQDEFTDQVTNLVPPRYRLERVQTVENSPLVCRIDPADNTLDDIPVVDRYGNPEIWRNHGQLWASSSVAKKLQELMPNPSWVTLLENNEADDKIGRYCVQGPPNAKGDTQPKVAGKTNRGTYLQLETPENLRYLHLRLAARVQQLTQPVYSHVIDKEWIELRKTQYDAIYDGFNSVLGSGWQNNFRTVCYGGIMDSSYYGYPAKFPEYGYGPTAICYDASSPFEYLNGTMLLTSIDRFRPLNWIPAWEWLEARNPKSYREVSVLISNGVVLAGKKAGAHEVITPNSYQGYIQWLVWSLKDVGVPVFVRYYTDHGSQMTKGSISTPTERYFTDADRAYLDSVGEGSIKTATNDDYLQPINKAINLILDNPVLRKFWEHGKPVVNTASKAPSVYLTNNANLAPYPEPDTPDNRWRQLECTPNTPINEWFGPQTADRKYPQKVTSFKVYAGATELDGEYLVHLYTPCVIEGGTVTFTIPNIGNFTVPLSNGWGYWLVTPQPSITPEQQTTINKLKSLAAGVENPNSVEVNVKVDGQQVISGTLTALPTALTTYYESINPKGYKVTKVLV